MSQPSGESTQGNVLGTLSERLGTRPALAMLAFAILATLTFAIFPIFNLLKEAAPQEDFVSRVQGILPILVWSGLILLLMIAAVVAVVVIDKKQPVVAKTTEDPGSRAQIGDNFADLGDFISVVELAAQNLNDLVKAGVLKRDLRFRLDFERAADGVYATLRGSYQITNIGDHLIQFPFCVQIDVAEDVAENVDGKLKVVNPATGKSPPGIPTEIVFSKKQHPNGFKHYFETPIVIDSLKSYEINWKTSRYKVEMPYSEFYATAHPCVGMTIEFRDARRCGIEVKAEAYRSYDDDNIVFERNETEDVYTCNGPFLPYQGMLLRVSARGAEAV